MADRSRRRAQFATPYAGYRGQRNMRGAGEPGDGSLALTTSQVASRIGISLGTVRRWADHGHLRSYRTPGGQRRFSVEDVERFVASLERRGGSAT